MCKKVVSLIFVFILAFSICVYGDSVDEISFEGYDKNNSTLEELAAKRATSASIED